MKKSSKTLFAVLVCAALALLAGCSGTYRADANFPYDIAVTNGYTGTEAEWLTEQETSGTVYRRMYEEAVGDGSFTGSYFEFLKQLDLSADATPYINRALLSVVSVTVRVTTGSEATTSSGSGVIYQLEKDAGSAYILTNYHVLYLAAKQTLVQEANVYLYGYEATEYAIPATYFGGSMEYDLALLRVENSELLRRSDACEATIPENCGVTVGEDVYAIGNPLNKNLSVTGGVVSVEEEWVSILLANESSRNYLPEIRIDADVNHGNSGGGLFNSVGELVGIVNARDSRDDVKGFGYAIPIELAKAIADNLYENNGSAARLRDGLSITSAERRGVYDETAGKVHISEKLVVTDISAGACSRAGVNVGDTLVSGSVERNGVRVAEVQFTHLCAWEAFLFLARRGDTLNLVVSRGGEEKPLRFVLQDAIFFDAV